MFNMRVKGVLEYDQIVDLSRSHNATLMSPVLYQLNTDRTDITGTERKLRRCTYGRRDRNKQNKVILMVLGETTLINTMINYLLGVMFEDEEFYQITEEEQNPRHLRSLFMRCLLKKTQHL